METLDEHHEVIVVDDASTDATVRIAQELSVRVLCVEHRNISRTRNAGARTAQGEVFFFIDADTRANKEAVCAGLHAMRSGAAGGGSVFKFDRPLPLCGRILCAIGRTAARLLHLAGGCFLFCTRDAYSASGGFPEELYAAEDVAFIMKLKKVGRVVVTKPTVITSGRKLDVMGSWELIAFLLAIGIRGPYHKTKDRLDFLYGQRAQACKMSRTDQQNTQPTGAPATFRRNRMSRKSRHL